MTLRRVLVFFISKMEEFIKVSGRMENSMVKEYLKRKMLSDKVFGNTAKE